MEITEVSKMAENLGVEVKEILEIVFNNNIGYYTHGFSIGFENEDVKRISDILASNNESAVKE